MLPSYHAFFFLGVVEASSIPLAFYEVVRVRVRVRVRARVKGGGEAEAEAGAEG